MGSLENFIAAVSLTLMVEDWAHFSLCFILYIILCV